MKAMTPSRSSRLNAAVKRITRSLSSAWVVGVSAGMAPPAAGRGCRSLADEMQDELAAVPGGAVLEDVDRLPRAERERAVDDRDRELGRGEGGADVRRHVVGTFGGMAVEAVVLRNDPA